MLRLFTAIALLSATPAIAQTPVDEMVEIEAGAPITIRPDRAYLVLRVHKPKGAPKFEPVFLRVPTAGEMDGYRAARAEAFAKAEPGLAKDREKALAKKAAAEGAGQKFSGQIPPVPSLDAFNFSYGGILNVNAVDNKRPLVRGDPDSLFLVETVPGDFVLYGASWAMGPAGLHICFCLGTVGFTARPGEVLDLGTFYADRAKFKSEVPELAAETGFGPSSDTPGYLIAGTVRPVAPGGPVPPVPANISVKPVEYRAVGKFFNPNASGINRLVPVPGVLAYQGGKVIDVKTGREASGAYPFR